ncbi:MAG: hypothetical protein A2790_03895 [Phenylobacterium sp. RIFCSPHIGHO2_01_FULL_69_31]|uniref:PEPxxWA-CTERM sorting domain-containing protein n=1 Tax=Phenylobacterium sp. RIFCSPHIGHO2_01_FULL_69_31 TaxID=1801944 RepID=UPI0008CBB100|nr:PEPxxWA-CTERM sorting domain-containing protein [Phenylobacterium sp. RIFCSPHIGHO2_01_FULL_69_31]OHB31949.1 MAG: hypothetical protein A2790_03895 [Phenylobacterium sp. RIFCSPHIGHO2_01_FULL_69_31]
MPRLSTLRCALIATSLFATSASAAELWATTQDSFGNARAIQYDLATGNIVQGVRLDFNLSGADSPISWDRMGSIAFDPEGKLWGTTQDSFGNARAIQYDLATGNIVQGMRLDFNLSGSDSPIAWARMGAIAFRDDPTAAVPEPATWLMMILGFAAVGMTARRRGGRGLTAAQA